MNGTIDVLATIVNLLGPGQTKAGLKGEGGWALAPLLSWLFLKRPNQFSLPGEMQTPPPLTPSHFQPSWPLIWHSFLTHGCVCKAVAA